MARETLFCFNTTVELADLRSFYWYTLFVKPRLLIPVLIIPLGVGLLALPRGGVAMWLGMALLAGVLWYISTRVHTWQRFKQASGAEIGSRYRVSIDRQGLRLDNLSRDGSQLYDWEQVTEVRELRRHFFIYYGPVSASILPKRDLPWEEQARLRKFFQQKFADKYHFMF